MRAYNWMLSRQPYGVVARLPLLHLGETRYEVLEEPLMGLDPFREQLLPENLKAGLTRSDKIQKVMCAMLGGLPAGQVEDVARMSCGKDIPSLLRYPIRLKNASIRDKAYKMMGDLGVSRMYPAALPGIENIPNAVIGQEPFPCAEAWVKRLLTLPVHNGVTEQDIRVIRDVLISVHEPLSR